MLGKLQRMIYGKPARMLCCGILSGVQSESEVHITCNHDHKTVERGLYTGVLIRVLRNEPHEPNLVVAVGDARYVLDRRIAERIRVR
jgi:Fe2+ transport system protein FeoA